MDDIKQVKKERAIERAVKTRKYRVTLQERDNRDLDIVKDYQARVPMYKITAKHNITRTRVYQILAAWGVGTDRQRKPQKDGAQ